MSKNGACGDMYLRRYSLRGYVSAQIFRRLVIVFAQSSCLCVKVPKLVVYGGGIQDIGLPSLDIVMGRKKSLAHIVHFRDELQ